MIDIATTPTQVEHCAKLLAACDKADTIHRAALREISERARRERQAALDAFNAAVDAALAEARAPAETV